jgi:hypothetical protein
MISRSAAGRGSSSLKSKLAQKTLPQALDAVLPEARMSTAVQYGNDDNVVVAHKKEYAEREALQQGSSEGAIDSGIARGWSPIAVSVT